MNLNLNRNEIIATAREIGSSQGHLAWERVRDYLLGGAFPDTIHYDNARRIKYALEEEDSTAMILPHSRITEPKPGEAVTSLLLGNSSYYTAEDLENELMSRFSHGGSVNILKRHLRLSRECLAEVFSRAFSERVEKDAYEDARRLIP